MAALLEVLVARIETLDVDAIVNAANRGLIPGAGVDGAIRDAAGPQLTEHLNRHGPLPPSNVLVTPGYALPARFVIHTAAPMWDMPGARDAKIAGLAQCYRACLGAAADTGLHALAFPALGTGIYGWPKDLACRIAIETTRAATRAPHRVIFCCFTGEDAEIYRDELGA
ncbi:MAG: macro domain-containing protein [Caulobacterales bacterium]